LLKSEATEQELLAVLQRPRFAEKLPPWFLPEVRRLLDTAEPDSHGRHIYAGLRALIDGRRRPRVAALCTSSFTVGTALNLTLLLFERLLFEMAKSYKVS
jgi:hypothetical protein